MPQTNRPLAAALWMAGSIASFSTMAVAARAVSASHDTFEIMTWRSLVGLIIVLVLAAATKRLHEVRFTTLKQHLLRNFVHFTGQNLWLWALTLIPMAQLFAIEFTSPIWVVLLAPLLLGEALTRPRVLAAVLGFIGALIVARPDFSNLDPGVLAAAGAALCFAITNIVTKSLTRGESIVSIMFWLTLMQLGLGLVSAGYDGDLVLPTTETMPLLVLIGTAGLLAHFCLTTALSLAPASVVMPLDFARLPVIALVGWLIYGETVEALVFVGAGFILAGIWINLKAGKRAALQQKRDDTFVTPRH